MVFIIIFAFFFAQARAFLSLCPARSIDEGRFIGSVETDISKFPYQVALQLNYWTKLNLFVCGGSIIKSDVILTSAYCTHGTSNSNWNVRAGSSSYQSGGQVARVKTITEHKDFQESFRLNDISLMFLQSPLTLGKDVKVVKINFKPILPPPDAETTTKPSPITTKQPKPTTKPPMTTTIPPKEQFEVIATGWGSNNRLNWCLSRSLRMINLNVITNDMCKVSYPNRVIAPSMMCASRSSEKFLNIKKNTCKDDIGGPLTYKNQLVGITSWGSGCYSTSYPIVFTRISSYKNWITSEAKLKA